VTILGGESSRPTRALLAEVESADPLFRRVPITLSPEGLRVWERTLDADAPGVKGFDRF
jgi:hypothetical protein